MKSYSILLFLALLPLVTLCQQTAKQNEMNEVFPVQKSEEEWKTVLNDEQFRILRLKGTERPHTSPFNMHYEDGVYSCAGCGSALFSSEHKFDAHCGWPSFDRPLEENKVVEKLDRSHGMIRTEILCASCGGHLGHVFPDGPSETTGMRYCINGAALEFE